MVQAQKTKEWHVFFLPFILLFLGGNLSAQQDPSSRVARLNYVNGNVSMEPAGVDEWAAAEINRPFTIGDYLYADQGGTAELHLDVAVLRMGSQTSFGFLNLDDRTVQLKLTEGDMYIRVHNFSGDQVFEVDTPNAAVNLLRDGTYRFRVDGNGSMTFLVVREGQAQVTGGGEAFTLNANNSATLTGTDQLAYDIGMAPQPDEFDQWSEQRDAHEARLVSAQYLPPTVIGYEDLDDYGSWQQNDQYGAVWYPRSVDSGWAPYQNGHWAWIDPWGWTWVDSMPWGFAPFHYGRWSYINNRWGWCPGPVTRGFGPVVRPYYAPALVAWFGGAHWGVGISAGAAPSLGWVPLGWGEVYTPSYRCSPRYFNNVNVYNTRIVKTVNITNVYNTVYVNKRVYNQTLVNARAPNAVMAMPQSAFASGRPVRQGAAPVRSADFARMQSASVIAPNVAPTRQAYVPAAGRPVTRPAPQVVQRQVIARSKPPAPAAAIQEHPQQQPGQPANQQVARQAARPTVPNVRQVAAVAPVVVRPGQRVGTSAEFERSRTPVSETAPAVRTNQPQPVPAPGSRTNQPAPVDPQRPEPQPVSQPVHGVPPNVRQGGAVPADNGRYTSRPQQPVPSNRTPITSPAEPNRQPTQADRPAYTPPQPNTQVTQPNRPVNTPPAQPYRQPAQPSPSERHQPPVSHSAPPNMQQPAPQQQAVPGRQQAQPEPRPETSPAHAPVPHETVPQERTRTESQPVRQPVAPVTQPAQPNRQPARTESQPSQERRSYPTQPPERPNPPPHSQAPPQPPPQPRQSPAPHDDHNKNQKPQ